MVDTASQRIDPLTLQRSQYRASGDSHENLQSSSAGRIARLCLLAMQRHSGSQSLAMCLARSVQSEFGCERVSIASISSQKVRMLAISDQIAIDPRRQLPDSLAQALTETANSDEALIIYSDVTARQDNTNKSSAVQTTQRQATTPQATIKYPAHASLYKLNDCCPVFSFVYPLKSAGDSVSNRRGMDVCVGVLVENPKNHRFARQKLKSLHAAISPVLHVLQQQLLSERHWLSKTLQPINSTISLGPDKRPSVKQVLLLIASVLLLAGFVIQVPLHVSAQAILQAKDAQVLIAPHSGFVSTSHVRAGDRVRKAQLLASLDTRDLQSTARKWESEALKNQQAVDVALAARDRVSLGQLRADADRIEAELALVSHQLSRADIRAPFDGVVLSGDLSQLLGASVKQGDMLFTIASDTEFELVLNVDEIDVGLLQADQLARIRMAAAPESTWDAVLADSLPMAVTVNDVNYFRVPAVLEQHSTQLRTGMEGIARIVAGNGSFFGVHTRKFRNALKRALWRMGLVN